jgi:hypothetical protein
MLALPLAAYCAVALSTAGSASSEAQQAEAKVPTEARSGEQIYRQLCASCHGVAGEGVPELYPKPLIGDRSVGQLSRLIAKTMPEDDPGACVGEDAEKVAAYIHEAFYSRTAQARNRPPRIELSRLTVRQYLNAAADLIGSFRTAGTWDDVRGLRGDYARPRGRRFRNGGGAAGPNPSHIDPTIAFNYGEFGPDPDPSDPKTLATRLQTAFTFRTSLETVNKFEGRRFSIRWEGSVLAPETGEYEFIIKTENAFRLWVNDPRRPLIDAGVKSGNDTEYRGTIRLLGGRPYPIRLEYIKSIQEKTASIALWWKIPGREAELIPSWSLSPNRFPETFVAKTPFPPDDRSNGYERGTSISKAWDQATTDGAIEAADHVVSHLSELSGVRDDAKDREPRLREFCWRLVERAFRRPLGDEEIFFFIDRQFQGAKDLETAVKRVVLLALKSPRFLYRELNGSDDAYDLASRLSFTLWDSIPDPRLLEAAATGRLGDRDTLMREAERMAADLRANAKLREFFVQWLKIDRVVDVAKDPKLFPEFDDAMVSDLRTSLDLFLDEVLNGSSADFRRLLLSDEVYLNGRLAGFYGVELPADAPFQKVSMKSEGRAGVLSHPYLMASFAYTATTSPIHRGVFLSRSLLGRVLRPPPEAVAPLAPDLHPDLTTRERVALQTKPVACQSCHSMINPLGFTLEHFDAVGRYRKQERGRPIDATGAYQTRSGETVNFQNSRDLAEFLASSEETQTAFVEQLFHYLVKQPIRAFGSREEPDLQKAFASHEFDIRRLMIEIAVTSALKLQKGGSSLSGESGAVVSQ